MAKESYGVDAISWTKGAEAVRANVALYLGATDTNAVIHLAKEVIGNSIDESASGFGDTICIKFDGNVVTVADHGRGIPVGKHPKHPEYDTLTLIATELHSGGKSKTNNAGYNVGTVGTHGLGLAVVNALSSKMEVWSCRNRAWWYQAFSKGHPIKTKPIKTKDVPKLVGHSGKEGTIVRFTPDFKCFDAGSKLDAEALKRWLNDMSWFVSCNVIKREKIVKRIPVRFVVSGGKEKSVIKSPGFDKYFDHVLTTKKLEPVAVDKPFILQTSAVDVLIGWSSSDDDLVRGYTNGVFNSNGGTHVKAMTSIIGKVFSRYAKKRQKYKVDDLLAGAVVLINIRMKSPRFDSQSKVRLVSEEAATLVAENFEQAFIKWAKTNQKAIKEIIERACAIHTATANMKNDRKLAAALKTKSRGKAIYPEGMLVSYCKDPMERELFICEGDSAKGSCVKASDRRFQEVLPLRGKIPNAMKSDEKAFASGIIIDILRAIGYTPQTGVDGLRVGKIVILTDADSDGNHISSLLMSLFQTIAPELYKQGRVFIADTPLFIYNGSGGKKTYAPTMNELAAKIGGKAKIDASRVTRAKGLGEVAPEILHEVAFNPETRNFIELKPEEVKRRLNKIMGNDVEYRRGMLGLDA